MQSVDKRLGQSRDRVSNDYQIQIKKKQAGSSGDTLKIKWQEALEKMYLENPSLITADHRVADLRVRQNQVWRNMIPTLTVRGSDSFTVENIADAFTDPSFRISSFISLGNLLALPKRVYANKLTYIGSELQAENTMRQQVIALYRLFQQQYLLNLEKKALDLELGIFEHITGVEDKEVLRLQERHRESMEKWEVGYRRWAASVGDFFMTSYSEIDLQRIDLPDIRYKASDLNFLDTNRWGFLQLNLLALEEIAERGAVIDTYLRYLPRANLSVSAPPLFSNTSNTSFDINNTRLSPSLTWSLDTRGSISQQLQRLKREDPIKQWRKDKRKFEEVARLLDGKDRLSDIQEELRTLRSAMDGYRTVVKAGLVTNAQKSLEVMRGLREREIRLAAQEIEISTSFWLIDEQRWVGITKRWQETRKDRAKSRKKANKKSLLKL